MKRIFLLLALVSSILTYASSPKGIGVFSVSADKQVTFSSGNLQYNPASNQWRFASNQTELIGGAANHQIAVDYDGWLDLFGWSTGFTYFGVSTSTNSEDYGGAFVDWGMNVIGVDTTNTWRTLSADEWRYVLGGRANASRLMGVGVVNGVNGLILLPDDWRCPAGVIFKSGFAEGNGAESFGKHQSFTQEHWLKLESLGAVFLPASGSRYGSDVYYVQDYGGYWSSTPCDSDDAWNVYIGAGEASMNYDSRGYGLSVRLVKDLQ